MPSQPPAVIAGDTAAQALDAAQLLDILVLGERRRAAGGGGVVRSEQLGRQAVADEPPAT